MIITSTPYRISFFGGGTDYPVWFNEHGGAVLATTINRYCHISCRNLPPFFDFKHRIVWSKIELVNTIDEIEHPVVREALRMNGFKAGMEIHHNGDLPARSGLGSSSSFTVGMLHALMMMQGKPVTKKKLALEAIHLEQTILKEHVGIQDQIMAAYGGLNKINIDPSGDFEVSPISISPEKRKSLTENLLLVYTGISRTASDVARHKIESIPKKQGVLHKMREMVDEGANILINGTDLDNFGRLLHESWKLKQSISNAISTNIIEEVYEKAITAGALGGKLLGAGGGGFMIFYIQPELRQAVLDALGDFLVVPFDMENFGTRVTLYEPDNFSRLSLSGQDFRHDLPE